MNNDPFKEYIKQVEPEKQDRGYAWHTAIGLQAVDGLTPSKYLVETAIQNIEGVITMEQAQVLLDSYYMENPQKEIDERTEEADKVSVRIAKILSEKAFSFTPNEYLSIHEKLFQGIYHHAGKIRDYNITKKEWVLDGATVMYGTASELRATLEYDFSQEKSFSYKGLSMEEIIHHLAIFVSKLWQIHVFGEGNTRTTAVFFIKYLRTLGFDAANDIFAENAWYFRNALVRANYNDLKNGVHETTEFLEVFLKNLLLDEHNELHNRVMHISEAFRDFNKQDIEEQKQDIETSKQDIETSKQDIETSKQDIETLKQDIEVLDKIEFKLRNTKYSNKTLKNIRILYTQYGNEKIFGRSNVMETLSITASPASELIKKLLESGIIIPVKSRGKGKYIFKKIVKEG